MAVAGRHNVLLDQSNRRRKQLLHCLKATMAFLWAFITKDLLMHSRWVMAVLYASNTYMCDLIHVAPSMFIWDACDFLSCAWL